MKTYMIHGTVVGSKYLGEVEAETAQEALDIAIKELDFSVSLCHQCSGQCEDGEIDHYGAENAADLDDSAQVDGFWEGRYYEAQARVHELEQHLAKLVADRLLDALTSPEIIAEIRKLPLVCTCGYDESEEMTEHSALCRVHQGEE